MEFERPRELLVGTHRQDADADGIIDVPVNIPPAGIDRHPLKEAPTHTVLPEPRPLLPRERIPGTDWETALIADTVTEFPSGHILTTGSDLIIRNSTLHLGRGGGVQIQTSGARLLVEDSHLVAVRPGYGANFDFSPQADLIIRRSTIDGFTLFDLHPRHLTIEDSNIRNLFQLSLEQGPRRIEIRNTTFSNSVGPLVGLGGEHVELVGNVFHPSLFGTVALWDLGSVDVRDNVFLGSLLGKAVQLTGQQGRVLEGSLAGNVFMNSAVGLDLPSGADRVYGNDFIGNANPAQDSPHRAEWSFNGVGNFWSNYQGSDANQDGVGDTPFQLPEGAVDRFPAMRPFVQVPTDVAMRVIPPPSPWPTAEHDDRAAGQVDDAIPPSGPTSSPRGPFPIPGLGLLEMALVVATSWAIRRR